MATTATNALALRKAVDTASGGVSGGVGGIGAIYIISF